MQSIELDAVVLGVMDYGEADKIVTLFALEQGKLKGLARNAKKSRKRFGGALEPFARLRLQVTLKDGLSTLNGADVINVFPHIRTELGKISHAAYACELVEQLVAEGETNTRLFRLLTAYLEHLDRVPQDASDRRFFEANLLKVLGYQPELARCACCDGELAAMQQLRLAPSGTGILCGSCARTGRPVSSDTISLLIRSLSTGRFGLVRFPPEGLAEAGAILDAAIACHLTRPLKSLAFMEQVSC
ncbi:DNA repair protein RecO [Geotalea sp. SG265]|uniref:DNA repair protein RecO n=1 Tax=Geotalea sp. SG265 TaxID=2922867 RepID=UPI001FB004DD|nr:DNA repair protein RecO [Geotalea sp. SG265]